MDFSVIKTSDYHSKKGIVSINSLEELLQWCKSTGEEVIINKSQNELEIYDDLRE